MPDPNLELRSDTGFREWVDANLRCGVGQEPSDRFTVGDVRAYQDRGSQLTFAGRHKLLQLMVSPRIDPLLSKRDIRVGTMFDVR